jgi:3-oxoadipate enol-lactonase
MLSNSLGSGLTMWDPQLAAFSGRFRAMTHGATVNRMCRKALTMERLGRDAVAVLDHLGRFH